MNSSLFNHYVLRILAAARPADSVSAISKRIGLSYGWTYKWVSELVRQGVFRRRGKGVELDAGNGFYRGFLSFFASAARNDVGLYYEALKYAGLKYAFAELDAVFVWTKGGYNLERSKNHYPVFVKVREEDLAEWKKFFSTLGLRRKNDSRHRGVFYVLRVEKDFETELVSGEPVVPLKEAVAFMKKYEYNFLPALEMVDGEYGLGLKASYRS